MNEVGARHLAGAIERMRGCVRRLCARVLCPTGEEYCNADMDTLFLVVYLLLSHLQA